MSMPMLANDSNNGNSLGLLQLQQMLSSLTTLVDEAIEARKDGAESRAYQLTGNFK